MTRMHPVKPTLLQINRVDSCESTNQLLLTAAEAGASTGTVMVTREQTAGRGRRGRNWIADPDSTLAFSLLWSFPANPALLHGLSLAVGLAIVRASSTPELGATKPGYRIGLKWPNDVLVRAPDGNDAKAGGVLIESVVRRTADGAREIAAIIGVGLNCLPSERIVEAISDQPVAALSDVYVEPTALAPETFLGVVLDALQQTLREFSEGGFSALRDEWSVAHLWQGAAVRVSEGGAALLDGEVRGVDADGALIIATPVGIERIISGDVSLRKV